MNRTPYLPDSARAAYPRSAWATLPPYLREDFAQSLDRSRPHELIDWAGKGKKADCSTRSSWFQYCYLDTLETITVPNAWHNQTLAMRVDHWRWHLQYCRERTAGARADLARAEASLKLDGSAEQRRKLRDLERRLEDWEPRIGQAETILNDVIEGRRFI